MAVAEWHVSDFSNDVVIIEFYTYAELWIYISITEHNVGLCKTT